MVVNWFLQRLTPIRLSRPGGLDHRVNLRQVDPAVSMNGALRQRKQTSGYAS